MFIGQFTHVIDSKKRVSLPSKFRERFGDSVILTFGYDKCINILPSKEWKRQTNEMPPYSVLKESAPVRGIRRQVFSGTQEVDVDSMGRILIPEFLKAHTHIKDRVVFTGVGSHVELWDEQEWKEYEKTIMKQQAEQYLEGSKAE